MFNIVIIYSNLVSSEIKCTATKNHKIVTKTTKPHKSNQKQATSSFGKYYSSGNHVLYIAGHRLAQESTHKNRTRISHMIEQHL